MYSTAADGVRLKWERQIGGASPPVLLVHGLGSDASNTWRATGWQRALATAGRSWIAPDLRGHGGSDRPHDVESYRPATMVADLNCVLTDADVAEVDVVGYSLGARIAIEFAAADPDRVSHLILGGFGDRTLEAPLGSIDYLLAHLPPEADRDAVAACAEGASDGDLCAALARVTAATLLVAGEDDEIAGDVAAVAGRLSNAAGHCLPRRNHFTALSAARFKQVAIEFLATGG